MRVYRNLPNDDVSYVGGGLIVRTSGVVVRPALYRRLRVAIENVRVGVNMPRSELNRSLSELQVRHRAWGSAAHDHHLEYARPHTSQLNATRDSTSDIRQLFHPVCFR